MEKQTKYSVEQIFSSLSKFSEQGITELTVNDKNLASSKQQILKLCSEISKKCPDLFLSLTIDAKIIDANLVKALSEIYCSLEIPMLGEEKNGNLLLDKKLYSNKAALLNQYGLIFGFNMEYGIKSGDTFKAFRDRLDFATSLYPNHIDFEQLENLKEYKDPSPTAIFSSKDLDFARGIAFACTTFYSCGRAVPWFTSVISSLKINPSSLFADFEEWQQCNNCSFETEFNPFETKHADIEKMQLLFLNQKFSEKHKSHLYDAVRDIVVLNGALSRVASDNEESVIETTYNPDDIFSPASYDLNFFVENVMMEGCTVKLFFNNDCPDYKIL